MRKSVGGTTDRYFCSAYIRYNAFDYGYKQQNKDTSFSLVLVVQDVTTSRDLPQNEREDNIWHTHMCRGPKQIYLE